MNCLIYRKIQLRVHVCDIYEGQALQQLTVKPYDVCAFRNVRELTFDLVTECSWDENSEYTFEGAEANILAFVQRIKEMAPRVNTVYIGITDIDGELILRSGTRMRFLLSNLSKLTSTTLLINSGALLMECPDIALACQLTCIEVEIDNYPGPILQLARLAAETLQTFEIGSFYGVDVSGLIQDDNDDSNYVEYPSSYPFGDDVVFRGSGATLEYLEVALYPEM
ncbi:hypothetical protein H4S07_000344, partial [Coemansia furcata]